MTNARTFSEQSRQRPASALRAAVDSEPKHWLVSGASTWARRTVRPSLSLRVSPSTIRLTVCARRSVVVGADRSVVGGAWGAAPARAEGEGVVAHAVAASARASVAAHTSRRAIADYVGSLVAGLNFTPPDYAVRASRQRRRAGGGGRHRFLATVCVVTRSIYAPYAPASAKLRARPARHLVAITPDRSDNDP